MKLTRSMMWGSVLGALGGVAATLISVFQFDTSTETGTSLGQVVAVGLLIGVPVTTVGGAFAGWVWDMIFNRKPSVASAEPTQSKTTEVGSSQSGRYRRR